MEMVLGLLRHWCSNYCHWSTTSQAYCESMGIKLKLQKSASKYSCGEENIIFLESVFLRIPALHNFCITERVNVPYANTPFLVCLDLLDKYGLYINNMRNVLYSPKLNLKVPLERKRGHIYLL